MPLPKLSDAQIAWVIQQVAAYIGEQRQIYIGRAVPLDSVQKGALLPFSPGSALDSARVVVHSGERIGNPPFYGDLIRMWLAGNSLPDFARMAAITFVDTIVSHEPFTNELLFHELVHVVQYQKLGLADFAGKYVRGFLDGDSYEAIPLEKNAYQLAARFAAAPMNLFSVEAEVQAWIDAGRF
ncbi:MAG: hypothetical protein LAN18_09110 [Acidobacteriia bacterium]|nr:hypothetical protein [Terriglobia bacterium]